MQHQAAAAGVGRGPVFKQLERRESGQVRTAALLRRVLDEFKLYEEFYRERGRNPSKAIPQDVFVANLKKQRA